VDPYSTHIPVTALALHRTAALFPDLPIMECGCGDYSSPMIKLLADDRTYVIYSADPSWASKYTNLADEIRNVPLAAPKQWQDVDFQEGWGLCLMDSEESVVNRAGRIPDLLGRSKVVVMHDAREDQIPDALYAVVFTAYRPWTWIGSNEVNVEEWFNGVN